MANLNKEYERGFKDGLKSKIGDELLPMSEQILVGVSDAVKSAILLMVDRMEIKANLDSNDWIPCGERLPDENQKCLVYRDIDGDLKITTGIWHSEWKGFDGLRHGTRLEDTIAWMPLPEPPKDDDEQEVPSDASDDSV